MDERKGVAVQYDKPWLTVDAQVDHLLAQNLQVDDRARARLVLEAIGYYRLIGYLYPFREFEDHADSDGETHRRATRVFRPGTTLTHAEDSSTSTANCGCCSSTASERIEVALRMRLGYVLGRTSAFAHEDPTTSSSLSPPSPTPAKPSKHDQWLMGVRRQEDPDEWFVQHFLRNTTTGCPVGLTEILELGQLSVLYRGMQRDDAEEIADAFGIPTKAMMGSWLASLSYVRNLAAHHARLFNRRLLYTPPRPKPGQVPVLDHLRDFEDRKFSTYNALAVIAYLMRSIDPAVNWSATAAQLLRRFPTSFAVTIESMGAPAYWEELELWK